jgi:uncharacterized membrane protein
MSDMSGDWGFGIGVFVNIATIGLSFNYKNKKRMNALPENKAFMCDFIIVFCIFFSIVYIIVNLAAIRPYLEHSGWIDWIFFTISFLILVYFGYKLSNTETIQLQKTISYASENR